MRYIPTIIEGFGGFIGDGGSGCIEGFGGHISTETLCGDGGSQV